MITSISSYVSILKIKEFSAVSAIRLFEIVDQSFWILLLKHLLIYSLMLNPSYSIVCRITILFDGPTLHLWERQSKQLTLDVSTYTQV